jgi:predicted TPR repeat methyltransferase
MGNSTIQDAMEHHQNGRLVEAESIYLRLLQARPNDPEALHCLGVLRMNQGKRDEAIALVKKSVNLAPGNAHAWNNLGNMLVTTKETQAAEYCYLRATTLKPDLAESWYNLGNVYRRERRRDDAVRCFRRVVELHPRFANAYENLAMLLKQLGQPELTGEIFRQWRKAEPDNPIARHMAIAYSNEQAPARADNAYVVELFDRFAKRFDKTLAMLHYAAPSLLVGALSEMIPFAERRLVVLDAGCGTGLCGVLLRSTSKQLIGVDLSAGMLEVAKERNVYDELHESELVAFMRAHPASYDLVISGDTLVYFGALEEAMSAAAGALKAGGLLAFTVEAEPRDSREKFKLHNHGRYTHGAQYVRECIEAAGFTVLQLQDGVLRQEAGTDVLGYVVVAKLGSDPIS